MSLLPRNLLIIVPFQHDSAPRVKVAFQFHSSSAKIPRKAISKAMLDSFFSPFSSAGEDGQGGRYTREDEGGPVPPSTFSSSCVCVCYLFKQMLGINPNEITLGKQNRPGASLYKYNQAGENVQMAKANRRHFHLTPWKCRAGPRFMMELHLKNPLKNQMLKMHLLHLTYITACPSPP